MPKFHHVPSRAFRIWEHLFIGKSRPKFTDWVQKSMPEHLDHLQHKSLGISGEELKEWGYSTNPALMMRVILPLSWPFGLGGGSLVIPPSLFDQKLPLWL